MIYRVSQVEAFRQWREDEDKELADLEKALFEHEETEAMRRGTAFHLALENLSSNPASVDSLVANGYIFHFECDVDLALPQFREIRHTKNYGGIDVTGKVDCLEALKISDYKSTGRFDPDRYLAGYQWRYYLDIFNADFFRWNIFEMSEGDAPDSYIVTAFHRLEECRYPRMEEDCRRLAIDLREFSKSYFAGRTLDVVSV